MALKRKPKCLNINFNFSDDSEDENKAPNVQTKHVLKELKVESSHNKNLYLLLAADKTIVAGDHLCRSELPSLSEDIGLPVTESTLLFSCDTDNTMYLTALEDNQSKSHHIAADENKNSCADNNTNIHKLCTRENWKVPKRNDAYEEDKENVCLISDKTKERPKASKLSQKSFYYQQKNDLEWSNSRETSLRESKFSTRNKLCEGDMYYTPVSAEYNDRGVKGVPSLREKLPIIQTHVETNFSNFVDEKASPIHSESILDSFVEVQDISIQTSLVLQDSQDSQQDIDKDCYKLASDSEDAILPCSPLSLLAHQSNYTMGSEQSSGLSVRSIGSDVVQDNSLPLELSSYEVQDISVQTSFDKASFKPVITDNSNSTSSVVYENIEVQHGHTFEKSEMKLLSQNDNKESVERTSDMDSGNRSSEYLDYSNKADIIGKELYETAYENIGGIHDRDIVTSALRQGEGCEETNSFRAEQDSFARKTFSHNTHEYQTHVYENHKLKSDIFKQSFGNDLDKTSNFTSNLKQASVSNFADQKTTHEDMSVDIDDVEKSCDVLFAASDIEDDEVEDNLHNGHSDNTVDKIDESDLSGTLDTNDSMGHCGTGNDTGNSHNAENIGAHTVSSKHNTRSAEQNCEEKNLDSKSNVDHREVTIGIEKKTHFDEKNNSYKGDEVAKHFTKGHNQESVDKSYTDKSRYRSQRQDSDSSDDDSNFENFLSKLKSSSKPKKPSKETVPLSEFIVDEADLSADNDDSSSDEDNTTSDEDDTTSDEDDNSDEMFYIRTNDVLNHERESPPRYLETVYTHYHSDDSGSESEDADSDLDDFIVDTPPKKTGGKTKSAVKEFNLSSDDEFSLKQNLPIKSKTKTISEVPATTNNSPGTSGNEMQPKLGIGAVSLTPGKNKHLSIKKTVQVISHEDIDNFPGGGPDKTSFQIPRNVQPLTRSFETPARSHVKVADFKTPGTKGSKLHPTTCPRPSFGGLGLNDDAFFLKSLTAEFSDYKRHPDAARYMKYFKTARADLAQRLFKIFNSTIFQDKLPENFEIEWSVRYTKTAGTFHYQGTPSNFKTKVTLSVKVCDSPERVRDTLAHELCHAAVRLISGVKESHGQFWRSWAHRINRTFPFMPVIARCHNYSITTKYTYQCSTCKYRIGRHSKSLDTNRKICGHCHGNFELYLTKELNSSNESCKTPVVPQTPRTPNKFALFVKECYSVVKKRDAGLKHGDVMRILSQEFAEKNKICD